MPSKKFNNFHAKTSINDDNGLTLDQFSDIDVKSLNIIHDYNFENEVDDLDKQLDITYNDDDDEHFKNELLFFVQGLGSIKEVNGLDAYVKGPHCEESILDIIKLCKRDNMENPVTRIELAKWNVLQNDLLPLLITQPMDKKLSFYLLILLVLITDYPIQSCYKKDIIIDYLQGYKIAFLPGQVIKTLLLHLADCMSKPQDIRNSLHDQMIELIITLFKNLLKIPDSPQSHNLTENYKTNLQNNFIISMHREGALDAFIYATQNLEEKIMKKMNIILLEIFYHIFIPFDPMWLFRNPKDDKSMLARLKEKERNERIKRLSSMSSRHSRFDCNIKVARLLGGGHKIIHNPFAQQDETIKFAGQTQKPRARKNNQQNESIFPKQLDVELIATNAAQEEENLTSMKSIIKEFAIDFVQHAYETIIEALYDEIYKGSERIDDNDKIQYFLLMAFGLGVNRYKYLADKAQFNAELQHYDITHIGCALQLTQFDLIKNTLIKEITKEKKKAVSIKLFHAALYVFLQLLYCVKEMSLTIDSLTRKNAQILMQKIFTQDYAKIIRIGFNLLMPNYHDPKFYKTLVELMGIFFDMLEEYSKGKVVKIQTDKRLTKKEKKKAKKNDQKLKKKKNQDEEDDGFIEKDSEDENMDDDFIPENKQKIKKNKKKLTKHEKNNENKSGLESQEQATNNNEHLPEEILREPITLPDGPTFEPDFMDLGGHSASNKQNEPQTLQSNRIDDNALIEIGNIKPQPTSLEKEIIPNEEENPKGDDYSDEDDNNDDDDDDDEDDDDDGIDEEPQYRERTLNFPAEFANLADYVVISRMLNLISGDRLEKNDPIINQAVAKFIKRIVHMLKAEWLFFQIDYLLIFQDILNLSLGKVVIENKQLINLIQEIVHSFFNLLQKNKLASVECLFRFTEKQTKDDILNNYEERKIIEESQKDDPLKDMFGDNEEVENYTGYGIGPKWSDKADLLLLKNYSDYKDFDNCEEKLCYLFNRMNFTQFTKKDIKIRIKFLRLHKSQEKAEEIYQKLYKDTLKPSIEIALKRGFEHVGDQSFTKMDLQRFLLSNMQRFIEYKKNFGIQNEMFNCEDMAIVPINPIEFDILEWHHTEQIFLALDFKRPNQGEWYWRIPGLYTVVDMDMIIKKIEPYFTDERLLESEIEEIKRKEREQAMIIVDNNDNLGKSNNEDRKKPYSHRALIQRKKDLDRLNEETTNKDNAKESLEKSHNEENEYNLSNEGNEEVKEQEEKNSSMDNGKDSIAKSSHKEGINEIEKEPLLKEMNLNNIPSDNELTLAKKTKKISLKQKNDDSNHQEDSSSHPHRTKRLKKLRRQESNNEQDQIDEQFTNNNNNNLNSSKKQKSTPVSKHRFALEQEELEAEGDNNNSSNHENNTQNIVNRTERVEEDANGEYFF